MRCVRPRSARPPLAALMASVAVIAIAMTLAGCGGPPPGHDEEPHEPPAHHPRTFRRALDAIEGRSAAAAAGDAAARRELADIVRWLPALAADTELGRADWDRVRSISVALSHDLDVPGGAAPAGFADRCREAVAGLRSLAAGLPADPRTPHEDSP